MKRIGALLLLAALPCIASAVMPATSDQVFTAIYTAEWKWRTEQFPGLGREDDADADDSAPPDDHLAHVDAASQATRLAYWDKVLKQLADIPRDQLSPEQRINYDVYKPQIENLAAEIRFKSYEMPLNSDSQFWSDVAFLSSRHMKNAKEVREYIGKLNDFPRYFDENMDNMRAGMKRGFTVPQGRAGRTRRVDLDVHRRASRRATATSSSRAANCRRRSRPPNRRNCRRNAKPRSAIACCRRTRSC